MIVLKLVTHSTDNPPVVLQSARFLLTLYVYTAYKYPLHKLYIIKEEEEKNFMRKLFKGFFRPGKRGCCEGGAAHKKVESCATEFCDTAI